MLPTASTYPSQFPGAGAERGAIAAGLAADLVEFDGGSDIFGSPEIPAQLAASAFETHNVCRAGGTIGHLPEERRRSTERRVISRLTWEASSRRSSAGEQRSAGIIPCCSLLPAASLALLRR